ncbi:DUF1206 domain-containing protein [Janibacter melonis]|uniref:DUF1206 domain-containing protein n=1 Tax=Janibacter melonis TaxID=262209 RepID=UPI001E5032A8|nr:DUF1206 domain-containing protein [Janibacter melonis]MCB5992245.1 DUF1206 domain-containing protein [Janibacter melonis]
MSTSEHRPRRTSSRAADAADEAVDDAVDAVDDASSHPVVIALARVGHAVNGVLHLVIAGIALQLAWGAAGDEQADQSGALAALAGQPLGALLLWVFVVGGTALGLWYLAEVVAPSPGDGGASERAKSGAKGVVYLAIAWSAFRFATGSGESGSSEDQTQTLTQTLMRQPAGQWLVAAVGLVVVAVGAYYVQKGVRQRFMKDLTRHPGVWAVTAGTIGYPAKGAVLALVGIFFVVAAWQHDPDEAQGLDGALKAVKGAEYGPYLLTAMALGIIAFGIYCIARARYARLD